MSAESAAGVLNWLANNSRKVQSVIASLALYIGGLEAAHPTKSFWEILTDSGTVGVMTIGAGVLGALIAGWKTSSEPGKLAQKRQDRFDAKVADAVARTNGSLGDGAGEA